MTTLFTIGHSTRDLAEFSRVLQAHEIRLLVDIRAFPASRRHPHFGREHLSLWLPEIGVDYAWEKDLGGRRNKQMASEASPNFALRNDSFRNYADYMLSPVFHQAVDRLVERSAKQRTAIMCAELLYFRCHRMLVSDFLVSLGHQVLHIQDEKQPTEHALMKEARVVNGQLVYRGDYLL